MKKIIIFSFLLLLGLALSQVLPLLFGGVYHHINHLLSFIMFVALSYIMINVGLEFEIERTKIKSYGYDYVVAMTTAAFPWIFVTIYFLFLLPGEGSFSNWDSWKETLLLGRFAAPTSAGVLFTMLAAAGLAETWMFRKARVLAIFDDLDTVLLMIPLQIIMIGMVWQLSVVLIVVSLLLVVAWKRMNRVAIPHSWGWLVTYSFLITIICEGVHILTMAGPDSASIHIEILMPAFVLGIVMKCPHHNESPSKVKASLVISCIFMLLVGISMPQFTSLDDLSLTSNTITASQPMMSWGEIAFHVFMITILSNIGKSFPVFCYRRHTVYERVALSISMFARGEVGAGVLMIALNYNLGGPILIIAVLSLTVNLVMTGLFIVAVQKLLVKSQKVSK